MGCEWPIARENGQRGDIRRRRWEPAPAAEHSCRRWLLAAAALPIVPTAACGRRALCTAVVRVVPAGQLAAFQARRDADPVFRGLLDRWLAPVTRGAQARYCLLAAGGRLLPLTSLTARIVQQDWCDPTSAVGAFQAGILRTAAASGEVMTDTIDVSIINTTFFEAAFYRPGAPVATVAQRRAALLGVPGQRV